METIEYKGVVYTITATGVVTPWLQKQYLKRGWADPYIKAPDEKQVSLCTDWLNQYATPRKTVNTKAGSYYLKHVVERWAHTYIAPGAFIEAVRRMGWDVIPDGPVNSNACFRLNFARGSLTYEA